MKAIFPVLDESRQRPYYLQLYDHIKGAILSGNISEGEKLPSLRSLSKATGLSLTTVENAYNQLLVEGYIHSRASSGYYADRVHMTGSPAAGRPYTDIGMPGFDDASGGSASGTAADERMRGGPAADEGLSGDPAADMPAMKYDPDCFDFNKWKKCMNRVLNETSPTLFFEGSPQGEATLRWEISSYLYRSRGVSCHPDQIFIGAGTQQITSLLANILKDLKIENVVLETPGYAPVRNTFRDRGFEIIHVGVDANGLLLESLPSGEPAAAYVSPSNNSLSGSIMPIGRRYEMLRWAMKNDSYIIEDDYDSELRYFGRPIPPIKSIAEDERVIYLGSFSSTLFAAVKISYMVLPTKIAEDFSSKLSGYSQTCSKLEQLTLAKFMETGMYQTHIRKLRKLYSQKLSLVTDILKKDASYLVEIRNNASGIGLLLKIKGRNIPLKKILKDARSLGIPAVSSDGLVLLSYNQIPLGEIPEVIDRLLARWRS